MALKKIQMKNMFNVDLKNPHLMNMPTKILLAASVVAGILALGYFGMFQTQLEELSTLEAKEEEIKEVYRKKSVEAASLNNLRAELASLRAAFETLIKQLPTDAEIPNLIQELHQAGANNGLRLDSVNPQKPEIDGPVQKLPYSIAITGKYEQLTQFIRDVGGLSRIIALESLKLTRAAPDKNDTLVLSATANTYKARPAEELAAEAEERRKKAQSQAEQAAEQK